MEKNNRVIALRLPNWLGDVMMALPGLLFLKRAGFEVHLIGKKWIGDLFPNDLFYLHILEKKSNANIFLIKEIPVDKVILFPNSFSSAFYAWLAGKKTAGFSKDFRKWFLSLAFKKKSGLHEADYFWSLVRDAGRIWWPDLDFPEKTPKNFELPLSEGGIKEASQILENQKIDSPFIMICPSATGKTKQGESKIWPHWQGLVKKLFSENVKMIACPGPGEETYFRENFPEILLLDNIKLDIYAALMQKAKMIIANDSGPMHLAAAVNPKVLGIFGKTDPARTSPLQGSILGEATRWPSLEEAYKKIQALLQ